MSNIATKIEGTEDAWENGVLGADESHVKVASDQEKQLDAALDLHPISIRLQRGLLENLKAIAQLNGIGYQPLIRQILTRFVECEVKSILASRIAEKSEQMAAEGMHTALEKNRAARARQREKKAA